MKKSYVINLDRRPERFIEFCSIFRGMTFTRFPATDGAQIREIYKSDPDFKKKLDFWGSQPDMNPGVIGCSYSHYRIWQEISNSDFADTDLVLVMEDDAKICRTRYIYGEFQQLLHEVSQLPPPDMIYLGGRFTPRFVPESQFLYYGNPDDGESKTKYTRLSKSLFRRPFPKPDGYWHDRTTHAYMISKSCATKLVNNSDSIFTTPIDGWIFHKQNELHLTIYEKLPHLCYSPMGYKTDIQNEPKIKIPFESSPEETVEIPL